MNMPIVTVEEFNKIIEEQLTEGNLRPVFGLGKGGIGKTESIYDLAVNKLKIGYIDVRLLLYSEVDLKGIPYPDQDKTYTIWLQNKILPRAERDGNTGILVFDEITSCNKSLRTAAYQLLNERKLGEYELPAGWLVVCLGNGEEDGGDFQGMEGNFANRCSLYNVIASLDNWKDWAIRSGVNELVVAYVSWKPDDLHTFDPDGDEILFASPRSWKAVSDILNTKGFSNDKITNLRIKGNLGNAVGNRFIAFCECKNSEVNPADILNGVKVAQIKDRDILYITIQTIVKMLKERIDTDLVNRGNAISRETIVNIANAINWTLSLDMLDIKIATLKDIVSINRSVMIYVLSKQDVIGVLCPSLMEFLAKNRAVFER